MCAIVWSGCGPGAAPDDRGPVEAPRFGDRRVHLDLLAERHLADVDHGGLYVDFGTPARMKYTLGNWRTGFGRDRREGSTTFSTIQAETARLYFAIDRAERLTLRLRARSSIARTMKPYLDGTALATVRLEAGAGFRDYDVAVPASAVVRGEASLLLRLTPARDGDSAAPVALDSLRVIAGTPDPSERYDAPDYPSLAAAVRAGGVRRRALVVRVPTTLSWYVDVPPHASLAFGVAADDDPPAGTTVTVSITPDGGSSSEIFARAVSARWQDATLPLDRWTGRVVRLELGARGPASTVRVGWSAPAVLVPPAPRRAAPLVRPRNVVLVLVDTLRADRVRAIAERTRVQTPALDRLAREGAVFTAAQANESWTLPSTSSILTGLSPTTHGVRTGDSRLPAGATPLSETLRDAGFETAAFVSSVLIIERLGFDRGWSLFRNFSTEDLPTVAEPVFRDAGEWIEQHARERFFVYVHTIDPHAPYAPPDEYLRLYDSADYAGPIVPAATARLVDAAQRNPFATTFAPRDRERLEALYDGEISYHDHHLGELIARLERIGVLDETLFVLVADHGEELGDHASWGHGHTVYQELLRVPLVMRFPGAIRAGQRVDATVSAMDLMPTVLELLGVRAPRGVEAQSVLGYVRDARPLGPAVAFSELHEEHRVVRAGRWKLAVQGVAPTFFDLASDPGEQHPLGPAAHSIARRYCRILLGQFLGAGNRAEWLAATPSGPGLSLPHEHASTIDAEQCRRLAALGYATAGCPGAPVTPAP